MPGQKAEAPQLGAHLKNHVQISRVDKEIYLDDKTGAFEIPSLNLAKRSLAPNPLPQLVPVTLPFPAEIETDFSFANEGLITPETAIETGNILIMNRGVVAAQILRSAIDAGIGHIGVVLPKNDEDTYTGAYAKKLQELTNGRVEIIWVDGQTDSVLEAYKQNLPNIITKAKTLGYTKVDYGYGLFSEKDDIIKLFEDNGISSVGPTSEQVKTWGNKVNALHNAEAAGVPVLPWIDGKGIDTWDDALKALNDKQLTFPVLLKANESGGGQGILIANDIDQLKEYWETYHTSFENNGGWHMVNKASGVKHVEHQVIADGYGKVVVLGERDCSTQRKHQKIVEESPDGITEAIAESTKALFKNNKYNGPGTVEYLVFPDGSYYFIEMNTRLQVEHPATEAITGVDIIGTYLMLAYGFMLDEQAIKNEKEQRRGHAIEVRLMARNGGKVEKLDFLKACEDLPANVRIDTSCGDGTVIPAGVANDLVDPLQALIVVAGQSRKDAIEAQIKIIQNLKRTYKGTAKLNFDEVLLILQDPDFIAGTITTEQAEERFRAREEREQRIKNGELSSFVFRHGKDNRPTLPLNAPYQEFIAYLNSDSSLTDEGKQQIEQAIRAMDIENIEAIGAIMTSPLQRAVESARIMSDVIRDITGRKIDVVVNEDLKEIPLTIDEETYLRMLNTAEGDPYAVIQQITAINKLLTRGMAARAKSAAKTIKQRNGLRSDQVYAVVTHGLFDGVMQYVINGIHSKGLDYADSRQFVYDEGDVVFAPEPTVGINPWTGRLTSGSLPPHNRPPEGANPRGSYTWSGRTKK